jgi:predicted tellurium resistance membrane protein TerC
MLDFSVFLQPESWIAVLTLTFLEIVLGIDNIIFIAIIAGKLPEQKQEKARRLGLLFALFFRVGLLLSISWIMGLKDPLFAIFSFEATGRDVILFLGGVFLLIKTTLEIHEKLEGEKESKVKKQASSLLSVIIQIVFIDIIFSFDSILTAVGLTEHVVLMITAVIVSMIIMMAFAGYVSRFINKHPSIQMLALSFLIMIGVVLIAEAFHEEVPKAIIYSSVGFSLLVELLNMRAKRKSDPVKLHSSELKED